MQKYVHAVCARLGVSRERQTELSTFESTQRGENRGVAVFFQKARACATILWDQSRVGK